MLQFSPNMNNQAVNQSAPDLRMGLGLVEDYLPLLSQFTPGSAVPHKWKGVPYRMPGNDEVNGVDHVSPEGIEFIKRFEGFVPYVYYDKDPSRKRLKVGDKVVGVRTIGYGTTDCSVIDGYLVTQRDMTEEEATRLLVEDVIDIAEKQIADQVKVPLTQYQYDATASYLYNIGSCRKSPNHLSYMNQQKWSEAALEMNIVKSNGEVMEGLVTRREEERELFLNGTYDGIKYGDRSSK